MSDVTVHLDGLIPIEEVYTNELADGAVLVLVPVLLGVDFLVLEVVAEAVGFAHGLVRTYSREEEVFAYMYRN